VNPSVTEMIAAGIHPASIFIGTADRRLFRKTIRSKTIRVEPKGKENKIPRCFESYMWKISPIKERLIGQIGRTVRYLLATVCKSKLAQPEQSVLG
jgi:hypothetical protein